MRLLAAPALLLLLAGCTTVDDPFLATGSVRPDAPPLATEVAPQFAAALLPGAGAVESVRQTLGADDLQQVIVYGNATAGAGENALTVRIGRPGAGAAFLRAPTRGAILAEMRAALPGVAMTIDATPGNNLHGVYGYATGALGASGSCLYAWQYVKRIVPVDGATAEARWRAPAYAAQLRLRFCDPAIPPDRIASLMDGLRLKPVTRETFDMLRYAAGSGGPLIGSVPVVTAETISTPPRRKIARTVASTDTVKPDTAAERVPLPDEIQAGRGKLETARVPLPGAEAALLD